MDGVKFKHDFTDTDDHCSCSCEPIRHEVRDQQEMFEIFGQIWEDLETPCYIWQHMETH